MRSVPFHMGQFISGWTDKKSGFMHLSAGNRNFQFPHMFSCPCAETQ